MNEQGTIMDNRTGSRETTEERQGSVHRVPEPRAGKIREGAPAWPAACMDLYGQNDFSLLQSIPSPSGTAIHSLSSIDELLQRDKQREEDGFPRKIRVGRLVKPGRGAKEKIILVPTTVEEKFIHDTREDDPGKEGATGGSGKGEEGEVIGEEPIHDPNGSGVGGAGQGDGAEHEIESSAYDLGKILSEKFELPDLKDKGKKRSLTRYTYDLTDRNQGSGQVLDKKATLRKIVQSNISLENISADGPIDAAQLLVSPKDKVYRILSREKEYESQAMVFFVRDYSGSMVGKPTEIVVTQHVLIYSWLLYQYEKQVETRFILHDTEAKEVNDFYTYYNSSVAGGTRVESAYRLVNEIVEAGNLSRDYNIYVFHGTDGDDWDNDGSKTLPELEKILSYSNRVGITIAERGAGVAHDTAVEKYLKGSRLLEDHPRKIRLDTVGENTSEGRLIEGIRNLIG
jgi:uncharacterized sporulation protein YeaH/YhbH (DUF444 family)